MTSQSVVCPDVSLRHAFINDLLLVNTWSYLGKWIFPSYCFGVAVKGNSIVLMIQAQDNKISPR